jgi:putative sigma-54 modulation protein
MQIEYTGRSNVHVDEALRSYVERKLPKVTKLIEEPIEVHAIFDIQKHRHIAELHITHRQGVLHVTEEADKSLQDAVNLAIDKAEKQARRSSKKRIDLRRRGDRNGQRWPLEVLERESVGAGATPRVVESTHLQIKPMTIEEAAIELETSEHGFVVFRDSESDRLNVLYRRKDDNYGLIAPGES